jgi:hypothetical protein
MKKVLMIGLFIALCTGAEAQQGTPGTQPAANNNVLNRQARPVATPEMRAQQMINGWIFERLNLTADQKTKAQAILVDQFKTIDVITGSVTLTVGSGDRQAQMAALQSKIAPVAQENEKRFLALLKADQKKTYAEVVKLRPTGRNFGENIPIQVGATTKNPDAHDPVMAKEGDTYYVYYTNGGISSWSSKDLITWKKEAPVFSSMPAWVPDAVPGFRGTGFWAPVYVLFRFFLWKKLIGHWFNN